MLCAGLDKRCNNAAKFFTGWIVSCWNSHPFWKNAHLCCGWFQPTIAIILQKRCFSVFFFGCLGETTGSKTPDPPCRGLLPKTESNRGIEICRSFDLLKRWRLLRRFSNTTQSLGCSLPGREVGLFWYFFCQKTQEVRLKRNGFVVWFSNGEWEMKMRI